MENEIPDRGGWVTGELATYPPVPPFPSFTRFEQGVLETMADAAGENGDIFRQQLRAARVVDRINTVVGFYTRIVIERGAAPLLATINPRLSGCQTELAEANYGLVFILSYEDGYLSQIEGCLNSSGNYDSGDDTLGGSDLSWLTLRAVEFDDGMRMELPT
ncbi:MAG: hypothetical protein KF842_05365 [Caulobacter sp.]|nr:hypothetical protein [Caulobacter sp.]